MHGSQGLRLCIEHLRGDHQTLFNERSIAFNFLSVALSGGSTFSKKKEIT